jgi:hypothetical protein
VPADDLRTDVPHASRIYDYVLGGKDNFEPDRRVADEMMKASPLLQISMLANRRFMARAAAYLAGRGFRQFLDIGTGLPTRPNLHEVVQRAAPDATVVYVDNDPLVLVHARALLVPVDGSTGALSYLSADLRDPDAIFAAPEVADAFDLTRPVAVTLIAVLQLIGDDTEARAIIDNIMERLAPGSALVISAVTSDNDPGGIRNVVSAANSGGVPVHARTHDQVTALFGDLGLEAPGVVPVHRWHPDEHEKNIDDRTIGMFGGIAFKA